MEITRGLCRTVLKEVLEDEAPDDRLLTNDEWQAAMKLLEEKTSSTFATTLPRQARTVGALLQLADDFAGLTPHPVG